MPNLLPRDENGNPDIKVFDKNGAFYGGLLGMFTGVIITGPHFFEWMLISILLLIAGTACAFGFIGMVCTFCIGGGLPDVSLHNDSESASTGGDGD